MDIKCRCGRFARINMGFEWVCFDCRAIDLKGTHEEDWRDYEVREKFKELNLYKMKSETPEDYTLRMRAKYKELAQGLGKFANNP